MVSFATVAHVQEVSGNSEVTQKSKGLSQIGFLAPYLMYTLNNTDGKHIRIVNRTTKTKSLLDSHSAAVLGIRSVQGPNLVASFTGTEVFVWSIDKTSNPTVLHKYAGSDIVNVQWVINENKLKPDLLVASGKTAKFELVCLDLAASEAVDVKATEVKVIAKDVVGPHFAGASTGSGCVVAYAQSADLLAVSVDGKVLTAPVVGLSAVSVNAAKVFRVITGSMSGSVSVFEAGAALTEIFSATAGDKSGAQPVQAILPGGKLTIIVAGKVFHALQMVGPLAVRNVSVNDFLGCTVAAGEEVIYSTQEQIKSVALVGKSTQFVPLPTSKSAASTPAAPAPQNQNASPPSITSQPVASSSSSSNPLRNPTLASKVDIKAASQEATQAIANLAAAIQNARAATAKVSEARRREVEDLVDIALNAQQQGVRQSGGVSEGGVELTEDVVRRLMVQLAESIKVAIVPAVEAAASDICARAAKDGVKAGSSKASEAALRAAVDDAVKGVAGGFAEHLKAKNAANEASLRGALRRMTAASEEAIRKLRKDKADLEAQLNVITNSSILLDVRKLQEQVAQLKAQQGPVVTARPEDVASTAFNIASEGNIEGALQHVISSRVPQAATTLITLFAKDQTVRDSVTVPSAVWGTFLAMGAAFVANQSQVYDFVDVAYSVMDDHPGIVDTAGLFEAVAKMRDTLAAECDKALLKELNTLVNDLKK